MLVLEKWRVTVSNINNSKLWIFLVEYFVFRAINLFGLVHCCFTRIFTSRLISHVLFPSFFPFVSCKRLKASKYFVCRLQTWNIREMKIIKLLQASVLTNKATWKSRFYLNNKNVHYSSELICGLDCNVINFYILYFQISIEMSVNKCVQSSHLPAAVI